MLEKNMLRERMSRSTRRNKTTMQVKNSATPPSSMELKATDIPESCSGWEVRRDRMV